MVWSILYEIAWNDYYIELDFETPDFGKPNSSKVHAKNTIINNTRYENRVIKYVIIYISGNPEASRFRIFLVNCVGAARPLSS